MPLFLPWTRLPQRWRALFLGSSFAAIAAVSIALIGAGGNGTDQPDATGAITATPESARAPVRSAPAHRDSGAAETAPSAAGGERGRLLRAIIVYGAGGRPFGFFK